MILPSQVSAAILAGGQSRRMGENKALMLWKDKPVLRHVLSAVRPLATEHFLITNRPSEFHAFGVPCVPDLAPGQGPLAGIQAALHETSKPYCLVVACDMPLLTSTLLSRLSESIADKQVAAFDRGRGPEPLCALYHVSVRHSVDARIAQHDLRAMGLLRALDVAVLPVNHAERRQLTNVNSPEDFKALG